RRVAGLAGAGRPRRYAVRLGRELLRDARREPRRLRRGRRGGACGGGGERGGGRGEGARYMPAASRPASASGTPLARISACVRSTSYSTRRNDATPAPRSSSSHAARGSPSRGGPAG